MIDIHSLYIKNSIYCVESSIFNIIDQNTSKLIFKRFSLTYNVALFKFYLSYHILNIILDQFFKKLHVLQL